MLMIHQVEQPLDRIHHREPNRRVLVQEVRDTLDPEIRIRDQTADLGMFRGSSSWMYLTLDVKETCQMLV